MNTNCYFCAIRLNNSQWDLAGIDCVSRCGDTSAKPASHEPLLTYNTKHLWNPQQQLYLFSGTFDYARHKTRLG